MRNSVLKLDTTNINSQRRAVMGICKFCGKNTKLGCKWCRKIFCCSKCRSDLPMLRHLLECGRSDMAPAPTTGAKHQSKRRKTEGSDSQNGSPGLGAQPEEFGDESELEGSQPSSSYNEPPAAQPYDMDDYGNQSFATQAGENQPMLSLDPEGLGFSQEKQVEAGDQEEQSIQDSEQERSIDLDMADYERMIQQDNNIVGRDLNYDRILDTLRPIYPKDFPSVTSFKDYVKNQSRELRLAMQRTLVMNNEVWYFVWKKQQFALAFFLLSNIIESVGILAGTKGNYKYLLTGCKFDSATQKKKCSLVLIYKSSVGAPLVQRCWELVEYFRQKKLPVVHPECVKRFLKGSCYLTTPQGPLPFLSDSMADFELIGDITISIAENAFRFTRCEGMYAPPEYYRKLKNSSWEKGDHTYYSKFGITYREHQ